MPNRAMRKDQQPETPELKSPKSEKSIFGKVLKTFGSEGELLIKITSDYFTDPDPDEPIFIVIDGISVPFFFKRIEPFGRRFKVVFENMESEKYAGELVGKTMYVSGRADNDSTPVFDLNGCTVYDKRQGYLGKVSDFFDYPGNPCIEVKTTDKTILIPLHEDFIHEIDKAGRIIRSEIPEGLYDI